MFTTRTALVRTAGLGRCTSTTLRPSCPWLVPSAPTTTVQQRAGYAIPPHDKKDDDLGGPGGQEAPNPEHRKRTNRSLGGQAAMIIALGVGCVAIFSTFAAPRQIAQHQIDNDTVIGGPNSNTGGSLAKVKHREGTKTSHQLHDEQTGSSVLGNK